jgi:hypothetical protein
MLNERSKQTLFDQIHKLWIEPEIFRRNQKKILPIDFKIYRCLIKLPNGKPPIVEFNDEVKWLAQVKMEPGITLTSGRPIFLHEVLEISSVSLPEIDGERVAFVYLFWNGHAYQLVFDFKPNLEGIASKEHTEERDLFLNKSIAKSLQAILVEKAVHIHDSHQNQLRKIGLWASPALLPYPLSKIIKQLDDNNVTTAQDTLVEYCNSQFIDELASKWWTLKQFDLRKKLLTDALEAHKMDKFGLSIYALIPQIEGIVTDWLYEKIPDSETHPFKPESRIKKFRELGIYEKKTNTFSDRRIGESVIEIILGSVLQGFKWQEPIDESIPSRHVLEHGRYEESMLTKENSIKLFLLLDTIYYIISTHSDEIIEALSE